MVVHHEELKCEDKALSSFYQYLRTTVRVLLGNYQGTRVILLASP